MAKRLKPSLCNKAYQKQADWQNVAQKWHGSKALALSYVLLKAGNDWKKEPPNNDLKPDWLKMSRSMNYENKCEYEKTTAEKKLSANVLQKNIQSVLEEAVCYVQGSAKRELLMHLPQDKKYFQEAN